MNILKYLTSEEIYFMVITKRINRMCEPMKIAICDDIREFAFELKHKIEKICAKQDLLLDSIVFTSPSAMLERDMSTTQALFLDIDMPEKNGLEAARELREKYPELILVFVTAFIEYAPVGYNVSAFRYLLKQQLDDNLPSVIEDIQKKLIESSAYIIVEQKSGAVSVPLKDILYLEGTQYRMVLFHQINDMHPIEATGKLSYYEQQLKGRGFLRLQRSFIANMSYIAKISNYQVCLKNGVTLNASEKDYKQIQALFLQWKGRHL